MVDFDRSGGALSRWRCQILLVTALLAAAPKSGAAQDFAEEVRALAAAVDREQAELGQLRTELEQRSEKLAILARQLDALTASASRSGATSPSATVATVASTPAPRAEMPAPPPPEDEPTPPRVEFYGDSRVRYETLRQTYDGCVGCPNRQRGRLRIRFGAEGRLAADFRAVVGLGLGEVNDPNTVYANLGGGFSRKVTTWDRAFIEYHPQRAKWLNITAGKFPYPWLRSSMTFDVDFYPEGLSQRIAFDLKHGGALEQVSAQAFELIFAEEPFDRHMTIGGGQVTARLRPSPHVTTTVAATTASIRRPELLLRALLDGSDVGVRNTNTVVQRDGQFFYAGGFHYVNVIVENAVRTRWEAMPITIGLEYQRNLRAGTSRDTAWSFRFDGGRAQKRGDWDFGVHIFRVDQDAILAGLGESDWRTPSNVLQQRWALNRMMHPNVQLSFTLYRGRTLDVGLPDAVLAPGLAPGNRDPWVNRAYLDVTYRY